MGEGSGEYGHLSGQRWPRPGFERLSEGPSGEGLDEQHSRSRRHGRGWRAVLGVGSPKADHSSPNLKLVRVTETTAHHLPTQLAPPNPHVLALAGLGCRDFPPLCADTPFIASGRAGGPAY